MNRAAKWTVAVIFLLCGGTIYTLYRPETLLLFRLFDQLGWTQGIAGWRESASTVALPEWTVYSLPNGLWSAAYILIADAVHGSSSSGQRLCVAGFIPLLGVVSEVLQGFHWLRGTFDWADMAAYIIPFAIYLMIIKNERTWNLQANK
ncbi:MAG: hypothetical protein IJT97_02870 [Bacteroidaceae bacterium]|nr:hypothetical protein [Bacteroidaceae bacterium]